MRDTGNRGEQIERSSAALRWATHSDLFLGRVIQVLAEAAGASGKRLAVLEAGDDPYELDYEGEVLEAVLGSMFVVWQTFLSTMVSAILALDSHCRRKLSRGLSIAQGDAPRRRILRFGTPLVGKTERTGPEIIDAFANYFKHRDEWPSDWRSLSGSRGGYTADVIRSCGAKYDSDRNFRLGIQALGVDPPYSDFTCINTLLIAWVSKIEQQLRSEIESADRSYTGRL